MKNILTSGSFREVFCDNTEMRSNDMFLMAMQIVECVYDSALLIRLEKTFGEAGIEVGWIIRQTT